MKRMDSPIIWGAVLIVGGFFFMLMNFGLLDFLGALSSLFVALLFGAVGLVFLYVMVTRQEHWWAAIPGFTLMGLGATILVSEVLPFDALGGFVFLGSIGVSFFAIYLMHREHWWAIIPGGVLGTLAVVALGDELFGFDSGGLFFLGLAATFALVALLPAISDQENPNTSWAWFPAAGLLVFAILIGTPFVSLIGYVWPLALIGGGLYLILKTNLLAR